MAVPVISIFFSGDYQAQVRRGVQTLQEGGVVVLPTETVYGAGALLTHASARERLRALRGANAERAFTVHLASPAAAYKYIDPPNEYGERLIKKLWPGPVALSFRVSSERRTSVAQGLQISPDELYDGDGITLRCPDHVLASDVIAAVDAPIALVSPGTWPSGSAWRAQQVAEQLEGKVDLLFDAGPTKYSKPSTILRVLDESYQIIRPGVYDERIIDRLLRTTILFVCSGNTCRSPMAEAIARHLLSEKLTVPEPELEKKGISVVSAGSVAMPGARATPQAVEAVRELGGDLSQHRSKPLTVELIHQADMIFTMSRGHAHAVTALVPSATEKVATLDPAGDIEDPIGGDVRLYQDLGRQLRDLIEKRLQEKVLTDPPQH